MMGMVSTGKKNRRPCPLDMADRAASVVVVVCERTERSSAVVVVLGTILPEDLMSGSWIRSSGLTRGGA
jgi:hypothetical protein